MDLNKGLLVPINYGGTWKKGSDDCWTYDAMFTRYVRVRGSTTYAELIDKISVETGISKYDNKIDVHAWMSFPLKTVMPPFWLLTDTDISTFIELNANKDLTIPFCISTSPKPHVAPIQTVVQQQMKVEGVSDHPIRKSVRKRDTLPLYNEENNIASPHIGLDDIKLTNQVDELVRNDDTYSINKDEADDEDANSNDPFDNDDPFDRINYDEDKHLYENRDPFDCIFDGLFDPYFGVFLKHDAEERNDAANPSCSTTLPPEFQDFTPESTGMLPYTLSNHSTNSGNEAQSTNVNVHVLKDFSVGELVKSKAEILLRLRILTVKANREFRVTHSDRERLIVRCVDNGCTWRLRSLVSKKHGSWIIRLYVKEHSCSIDARFKRHRGIATSGVIAQMVKDDHNVPGNIMTMLEKVYGIKISYWKAWKAKEIANQLERGNPEESFKGLPSYLWLLEHANPGTYSAYQLDDANCFVQCFVAFGPSIAGFKSFIRPVIAVDACFLKGRYRGKLFIATCMDGNNQIYPLAFGVAATENDLSWSWFFQQIRNVIGSREDLVFISDRHPSIEKCCMEQFPEAVYGICMFHLGLNMNARFKVKAIEFLYGVAKSYTERDFEERLHQVRVTRSQVYDYLIEVDPKKWARCFFPTRRYSIMTTNIAESMNALLKEAREFPIIAMLETIRIKLQCWFHDRLRVANKCTSRLTPYAERKIGKRDDKSRHFVVHPIDEFRFYIIDGYRDATVDINLRTCTCNKFQLNQLPCPHALRACRERNISAYTLCSRYYTIEFLRLSYALPLNPVPHRSDWHRVVPESVQDILVRPPVVANKKGRRRNKRYLSQGEDKPRTGRVCGRCREPGHNRQTCRGKEFVPSQAK